MNICHININRLRDFYPEMKEFKGFEVGEYIEIPNTDYQVTEYMYSNLVKITGFNAEHDIIHWTASSIYGGMIHSGSHVFECKKL